MTAENPKRLRMFAGPNGSGKTSLVQKLAKEFASNGLFQLHHFLNADDLLRDLREGKGASLECLGRTIGIEEIRTALMDGGRLRQDHPFIAGMEVKGQAILDPGRFSDAYVTASIIDFLRIELLTAGQSFSFETVMSHRSKIDFFARARSLGYRTYLYFIATESPHLNIYRVKGRAALGGHKVPEIKIVERYNRSLQLLGECLPHCYRAFLFDNSRADPVWLAQLPPDGNLHTEVPTEALPAWFKKWVLRDE